jgi:UDP-glucose 4-epimerase
MARLTDRIVMDPILVTGGVGFLGTHLCERFLKAGREVWALDLADPPYAKQLDKYENFHLVVDTIFNHETLAKLVDRCGLICHLAAIASPGQYVTHPKKTMDVGLRAGLDLIDLVRGTDKLLFFTSTSEVYGRNPNVPWSEDDDRVLGSTEVDRWCYSTSKAMLEHYIRGCHLEGELNYLNIRVFNAYGPRLSGRVLDKFIDAALQGAPLRVHGDGSQTRCFTYVDDLIDGIFNLLETPSTHNTVYNIGNPHEVTIKELAQRIIATVDSKSVIEYVPHIQDLGESYEDIPRRVPNISRIEGAIGWAPKIDLDIGLASTMAYRAQEITACHA